MKPLPFLPRRYVLAGLASLPLALPAAVMAQSTLDATTLGLTGDGGGDQTAALQRAVDMAAASGQILRLPAGRILAGDIALPGHMVVEGVPGRTWLVGVNALAQNSDFLVLRDIGFGSPPRAPLTLAGASNILIERCHFIDSSVGLAITDAGATIRDCRFERMADAAIHAMNSRGLVIAGNHIDGCGNAGIRIWRDANGPDGSIVSGNTIANIEWRGGGNGQNGNGINIFLADEVIVADNRIADCAFTAVRLNSTHNCQVSGNICLRSGEVAIFSEFAFSGSVIANNIIDGAASGISITNLDSGGQLATCSGNIVRNIAPRSLVNPDTTPVGIFAEADTAITGNSVQSVPGVAIAAGFGTFLRNVVISANMVSDSQIGIGVSVVEGAGRVHIAGNIVAASQYDIAGMYWNEVAEPDLAANASRYANVTLG